MKKAAILKAKKISRICLITVLTVAIIHISIRCIGIYSNPAISSAWLQMFIFLGVLYGGILFIILGVFLYFLFKSRK